MLKLSACVEMMYKDVPLFERFSLAAKTGVSACEIWGYTRYDFDDLKKAVNESGLPLAAMCVGSADAELAALYAEKALLRADSGDVFCRVAEESVKAAQKFGVPNLIITTGAECKDMTRHEQHTNIVLALRKAAPVFEAAGITAVLEPLNVLRDHRGYFLSSTYEAFSIIREVDSPNVKLLFDIYHQQITDGNLIPNITENIDLIGHFHVADTPGRNQPGTGEINYRNVFAAIEKSGYNRYVGLEFCPTGDSSDALKDVVALAGGCLA